MKTKKATTLECGVDVRPLIRPVRDLHLNDRLHRRPGRHTPPDHPPPPPPRSTRRLPPASHAPIRPRHTPPHPSAPLSLRGEEEGGGGGKLRERENEK